MNFEHSFRSKSHIIIVDDEYIAENYSHEIQLVVGKKLIAPDGKILFESHKKSESFLTNFGLLMQMDAIVGNLVTSITDTSGAGWGNQSTPNSSASWVNFTTNAPQDDDLHGIVIGTGTNAVTTADTKLQTRVLHGVGVAGKVDYKLMTFDQPLISGSSVIFIQRRIFTNTSGGSIVLTECGLYCQMSITSGVKTFCIVRDVDTPLTFPNNTSLEVNYTITVTV